MMVDPPRNIALDTETTGTNPAKDRIVELCIVEVDEDLRIKRDFLQRLDPEMPIPPEATAVHGISDADVAGQPTFADIASRVQSLLQDSAIIAYNGVRFDVPLLHNELVRVGRLGLPIDQPVIDPYLMFLQDQPRTLTGAVDYYLDRDHRGAHAASADVDATLDVLRVQWARRRHRAPDLLALVQEDQEGWLDRGRCFYREPRDGVVRFGFGKHKGDIALRHMDYLNWMTHTDFGPDAKAVARSLLAEVVA